MINQISKQRQTNRKRKGTRIADARQGHRYLYDPSSKVHRKEASMERKANLSNEKQRN